MGASREEIFTIQKQLCREQKQDRFSRPAAADMLETPQHANDFPYELRAEEIAPVRPHPPEHEPEIARNVSEHVDEMTAGPAELSMWFE